MRGQGASACAIEDSAQWLVPQKIDVGWPHAPQDRSSVSRLRPHAQETQQCPVCASEAFAFMTRLGLPPERPSVLCGCVDRHTEKTMKRLFVAMSLSMSIWACGGGSTTTPTAAPSPAPASPFAVVTGNYELTIEIDDKCAQIPPTLRVRRYNATLEDRGWHFPSRECGWRRIRHACTHGGSVAAISRRPMAAGVEQLRRRGVRLS